MNSVNMDFCYASIALLLFLHGCVGQDDVSAAPGADEVNIEVSINPPYTNLDLNIGESKTFSCKAITEASETPTFKWLKDGEEIVEVPNRLFTETRGNLFMLRFMGVLDADGGKYECVVSVAGQEASAVITASIIRPLEVHSDKNQFGVVNTLAVVECDVSGNPAPTITWKFANGSEISKSGNKRFIIKSKSMEITDLQFSDEGTYLCDIFVEKTGDSKVLNIEYIVVDLPKIDLPPTIEPNNPKVGDEVKIQCTARGTPQPTYSFKKDGNTVPDDKVDATSGILTITDVKREDEAVYECIASNIGGIDQKSNTLDVKIPPTISDIPDMKEATEKGQMTIECVAEGDPAPQVSWKKVGMETEYTSTEVHPKIIYEDNNDDAAETKIVKSKMEFDGVKASDAGSYVCTATNVVGTITEEVEMGVKYSPHFDVPFKQSTFYGWRGHTANLTCQASGNPNPTITWKRLVPSADGGEKWEDIENVDPFILTDLRIDEVNRLSTRSLRVAFNNDDNTLYGDYMCYAQNTIGNINKTMKLVEATAPTAPSFSEMQPTMSTKIQLSIKKPDENGGQPILSYNYAYHPEEEAENEEKGSIDYTADHTLLTIRGLKPATTYVVTITAKNAVGEGQPQKQTHETGAVSAPLKMDVNSNTYSDSATSYNLKWDEPEDGGSPITKFVIHYKQVTLKDTEVDPDKWEIASDKDPEFTIQSVPGGSARDFKLTGLKKDAYYELRLVAHNKEGSSDPAIKIIKTSKGNGTEAEGEETGAGSSSSSSDDEDDDKASAKKSSSASAGLGSGIIIAIIVIVIIVLIAIVVAVVLVMKRRKAAAAGDAEGGKKEDGKAAAEEEKLIQKESAKVDNENEKGEGIEEKEEFEPDQKPVPADVADDKPKDDAPTEPTIEITPDTPDKTDTPTA